MAGRKFVIGQMIVYKRWIHMIGFFSSKLFMVPTCFSLFYYYSFFVGEWSTNAESFDKICIQILYMQSELLSESIFIL